MLKYNNEHQYYYHDTADISDKANIGKGTYVWHFVHIREEATIGENCVIG